MDCTKQFSITLFDTKIQDYFRTELSNNNIRCLTKDHEGSMYNFSPYAYIVFNSKDDYDRACVIFDRVLKQREFLLSNKQI